jgi:hypothetical protein
METTMTTMMERKATMVVSAGVRRRSGKGTTVVSVGVRRKSEKGRGGRSFLPRISTTTTDKKARHALNLHNRSRKWYKSGSFSKHRTTHAWSRSSQSEGLIFLRLPRHVGCSETVRLLYIAKM